jgi:hypothetical protein
MVHTLLSDFSNEVFQRQVAAIQVSKSHCKGTSLRHQDKGKLLYGSQLEPWLCNGQEEIVAAIVVAI